MQMLSRRDIEYLLAVYEIECDDGLVRTVRLAKRMKVSPSTATSALRRLSNLGLIEFTPRRGARLTNEGRKVVLEILWRHGVVERLLTHVGLTIDEACEVAFRIQHLMPKEALIKICKYLGHPSRCPHGYEIPHPERPHMKKYPICRPK